MSVDGKTRIVSGTGVSCINKDEWKVVAHEVSQQVAFFRKGDREHTARLDTTLVPGTTAPRVTALVLATTAATVARVETSAIATGAI
jgi:hypothetical protein